MQGNIIIREFRREDFDEMMKMWIELGLGNPERGDTLEVIQNTLSSGGKLLIMENQDREIIGSSWMTNDRRRIYLHHFGIRKKEQGKGLSKPLLEESIRFAREQKLQIKLEVHAENVPARKLYEKYGFRDLGNYKSMIIRSSSL